MTLSEKQKKLRIATIVDLVLHFFTALVLSLFFLWIKGGWLWPALCILGSIFIDLDHFIDYFIYYGFKLDLKKFFTHKYVTSGKVYIVFHSWELILILLMFSFKISWLVPFAAGMTVHLLIDQFISHTGKPLFYFLTYRALYDFNAIALNPELYKTLKEEEYE